MRIAGTGFILLALVLVIVGIRLLREPLPMPPKPLPPAPPQSDYLLLTCGINCDMLENVWLAPNTKPEDLPFVFTCPDGPASRLPLYHYGGEPEPGMQLFTFEK